MKFKAIKIFKDYDYSIEFNVIEDNLYQNIKNYIFSGNIVDENELTLLNFNFTIVDDYTIKAFITDIEVSTLPVGNYKYKIDFINDDEIKKLALYGDVEVLSPYE